MAKKKDEKSEIEYNEDDSLNELDIPELDLGVDPGSGNRTPTERLSAGFVQGVKTDLTDQRKLGSRLRELMPDEYEYGFNAVGSTAATAGDLYNTVRKETREGVKSFKKMSRGYVDKLDGKIPEKLTDRLKALTETREETSGPSVEQQRNDQVAGTMASIFEAQAQSDAEARAEDKSERAVNSVIQQYHNQDQLTLLQGLREDVARQVNYQDQIAAKWQRKSLELQYRQLFVGRDLLTLTETGVKDTKEALREIVKNTSLPDYRKIELSEAVGQNFRDRILNSFGTEEGSFWDQLKTNVTEKVKNAASSANQSVVSAADINSQLEDMGPGIDGVSQAGELAGATLTDKVIRGLLSQGGNALGQNDDVVRKGIDIENALRGSQYELQEKARQGELIPNWLPFSTSINQVLQDIVPDMRVSDNLKAGVGLQDVMAPAVFDVLTRRSIVDIIPGYLSRIHEEMRTIRQSGDFGGGGTSPEGSPSSPLGGGRLEYDLHTGEFKTADEVKENIKRNVLKDRDAQQVRDRISVMIDELDPNGELTIAARQGLGRHFLEKTREGRNIDPVAIAQGDITEAVAPDIRDQLSEFFTRRFGVTETEDENGEKTARSATSLENSQLTRALGRHFEELKKELPNPIEQINAYSDIGLRSHLEELGIAKRGEDGSLTFNRDAYFDGIQAGGWGEHLSDEDKLKLAEQDSIRRVEQWQLDEEERERQEKRRQDAKEAYEATWLGRVQKGATDYYKEKTEPIKDTLTVKARAAKKTSKDFIREQSNKIREIKRSDDPKAAAREYINQQTAAIRKQVERKEISPQAAREYVAKQSATLRTLMKRQGLNPDYVNDIWEDVRSKVEQASIRRGEQPANISPGIPFGSSGIEDPVTPADELSPEESAPVIASPEESKATPTNAQRLKDFWEDDPNVARIKELATEKQQQLEASLNQGRALIDGLREEGGLTEEIDRRTEDLKALLGRTETFVREQIDGVRVAPTLDPSEDRPTSAVSDNQLRDILSQFMEDSKLGRQEVLGALEDIQSLIAPQEGTDTDRLVEAIESTVDPEYQESHLMLLTRIIETLEAQAVSGDVSEEKQSLLRRVASKTGSLMKGGVKGLGRFYSGTFSGIGMGIQGAGRLLKGMGTGVGGFLGSTLTTAGSKYKARKAADVYLLGQPFPALRASRMRKGLYFDQATNQTIETLDDLRDVEGDILEIDENDPDNITVALTLSDMEEGLYDRNGNPLFSGGFIQGIRGLLGKGAGAIGGFYRNVYGKPLNAALGAASWARNKLTEKLNRPTDVYVAGEDIPRMRAIIMERGGYFDAESGDVIDHQDKIRGPVVDVRGLEVISSVDIQIGLVDRSGTPIGKGKVGQYALKAVTAPVKAAKWGFDKSMELLKWGGDTLSGLFQGITGIFQRDTQGLTEETGQQQVDILKEIRDILDARLDKQGRHDTDDDGYRDGGWRERFAEDQEEEEASDRTSESSSESSSGLIGGLLGATGGGLAALRDKLTGRGDQDEEDGDSGGLVSRLFDNATNIMATAWGATKAWAGTKAAALGAGRLGLMLGGSKLAAVGAGLLSLPVLAQLALGAAVVGVGYLGYRAFIKEDEPGPLTRLRMLQYGFPSGHKDSIGKALYLEETLKPHTRVAANGASLDFESLDMNEMARECGVNLENDMEVRAFTRWFAGRFYPVYLTHVASVKQFGRTYELDQVDDRLNNEEKAQYLTQVKDLSQFDVHPYTVTNHPFDSRKTITVTADDIRNAFDNISGEIEEEDTERSESRARSSVLGGDFSPRNLHNLTHPDAIENRDDESAQAPTVSALGDSPSRPIRRVGVPLELASSANVGTVEALDAVRYRTYGLQTLDKTKIQHLIALEEDVQEYINYQDGTRAVFDGSVDTLASRNFNRFGLMLHHRQERRLWKEWFEYRFLPVYLRYLSGLTQVAGDYETAIVNLNRHPKIALGIAHAMVGAKVTVGSDDVPVWLVPSSPWPNYELNHDSQTIESNLKTLEQKVSPEEAKEEVARDTDRQSTPATPATPSSDSLASLEARLRGISNLGDGEEAASTDNSAESSGASSSAVQSGLAGSSGSYTRATMPRNEGYRLILQEMGKQGITDPEEQAMILAQMAHESGDFTQVEENLNYGTPALLETFDKYFTTREEAERFARKPEPIANRVYGGRMGNTEPGDGFKYRGRGFIQLTGKDNYVAASRALGVDYVNNPDLVSEPEHAARVSLWWWGNRSGLSQAGQRGDVNAATKLINGGYNGIRDRRRKFQQYLPMARSGELQEEIAAAANETAPSETPQVSEQAIASATQVGSSVATPPDGTQVADTGNRTPTQVQEEVENNRQTRTVSFAEGPRQQAGQLTTASYTAANDEPEVETSAATAKPVNQVANVTPPDPTGKPSTLRQQAASTMYVGNDIAPDARSMTDEQRVIERRQQENLLATQREERVAQDQQASVAALHEIIELTQRSVGYQRSMDANLEALLNETRQQNARPSPQQVPGEHRQDRTHDDLVAAARREDRKRPSELGSGVVDVRRKRYA